MALYAFLKRLFPDDLFDMDYMYHFHLGNVADFMSMCVYKRVKHRVGRKL